jgi:hypothetical protein
VRRAELVQRLAARAARHRRHLGARIHRELQGEIADAAGGAGDQHAASQERRAVAQRAQRRQPRDRQRRGGGEAHLVGQRGEAVGRDRRALGPAVPIHEPDHTRAFLRAAAIGRGFEDGAADILSRLPAFRPDAHQGQFAAIEREGVDGDQRLMRRR